MPDRVQDDVGDVVVGEGATLAGSRRRGRPSGISDRCSTTLAEALGIQDAGQNPGDEDDGNMEQAS